MLQSRFLLEYSTERTNHISFSNEDLTHSRLSPVFARNERPLQIRADMHLGLDGTCPLRCAILTKTEMARRRHKFSSLTFHEDSFILSPTLHAYWQMDGPSSFNGRSAGMWEHPKTEKADSTEQFPWVFILLRKCTLTFRNCKLFQGKRGNVTCGGDARHYANTETYSAGI